MSGSVSPHSFRISATFSGLLDPAWSSAVASKGPSRRLKKMMKETARSTSGIWISRRAMYAVIDSQDPPPERIHDLDEAVAQQVRRDDRQGDRRARVERQQRLREHEDAELADHPAPVRRRRLQPDAEEAQRSAAEDRKADGRRSLHDHQREDVRQD